MKILDPYIREIPDNSINTSRDLKDFKEYLGSKLSNIAERIDFFEQSIKKIFKILSDFERRLVDINSNIKSQKDGIMQNYDEDELLTKRVEKIEEILNV